ncbi:hypothetical protein CAC42_6184 [Sphaceloma murrayae]|uniref:Uncharacterized protein n=1 Tax=Sphaceloma murrayae TaxID=2082308 RepID=A0A2K1QTH0_9PEZI|nr:hypothetical protein CAC42_6184 [Sphaceloma murrayae]
MSRHARQPGSQAPKLWLDHDITCQRWGCTCIPYLILYETAAATIPGPFTFNLNDTPLNDAFLNFDSSLKAFLILLA